ncbi:MAG TPA: hypothetical protein VGL68_02435 [Solirubrobacteraceae bacterium]
MTLLRRAPREVYRVYGEAEFFEGAAGMELFTPATSSGAGERRLRRLAGAAMLAGAVGTMGGAVVLAGSRPARGSGRGAANGVAQALARARLLTHVQAQLARNHDAGGSDISTSPSAAGRARSVARAGAAHLAFVAEAASRRRIVWGVRAERTEQREGVSGDAPVSTATLPVDAPSGAASVKAAVPAPAVARSNPSSTTAMSPPPSAEHAEFGFER